MTAKQMTAFKEKGKREQREYLRSLGYKSDIFPAKFKGGKCGLSGLKIFVGDPVAYFRDFGLCHTAAIDDLLFKERTPDCEGCGKGKAVLGGLCKDCCMKRFGGG